MDKGRINFRGLLDSLGVPVISLSKDWSINYANEAYAELTDQSVDQLEGRQLLELFPDAIGTPSYEAFLQVLETQQPKCIQIEIKGTKYRQNIYPTELGFVSLFQEPCEPAAEARVISNDYLQIFNDVNDSLLLLDVFSNKIIDANKPACRMFGYSHAELMNKQVADLSSEEPPFTGESLAHWIKKVASNNPQIQVIEWLVKDSSGRSFWVEMKTKSTYVDGKERLLFVLRDITELKETQRRLRDSSDRYLEIFENSGDLIYVHDLDGNFLRANKMMEEVTGYWREELLNMNIADLVARESKSVHNRYMEYGRRMAQQKKGKHKPISYEIEIFTKHGSKVFVEVTSWLVYKNHEPIAVQGIAHDITTRKMEELALRDSQQMMMDMIEYLPDAVMAIDVEGKVIIWNSAMEELTGYTAEQMLGKGNYEYAIPFWGKRRPIIIDLVLRPDDLEKNYTAIQKEHYVLTASVEAPALRGEKRQIWIKAVPLHDQSGELLGAVESIRDMTEFQRIEEAKKSEKQG